MSTGNAPSAQEQEKAVKEILNNPENRKTRPEVFEAAEKAGIYKDGKLVEPASQSKADPVLSEIQARFGNAYTSADDFFTEVGRLKNGGAAMDFLQGMPEPLLTIIDDYTHDRPWEQHLKNTSAIDFSKEYTEEQLLALYYPGKFSQDELNDPENVAVKAARKNSKEAFQIQKQEKGTAKRLAAERKTQFETQQKQRLETSIEDWRKKVKLLNPNMKPEQISQMESRLRSDLSSMNFLRKFVDDKGLFQVEAVSNLFPISFAPEFTGAWKEMGRIEGEKVAHDILNNGQAPRSFTRKGGEPGSEQKQDTGLSIKEKPAFVLTPSK